MSIESNLQAVLRQLTEACTEAGRDPAEVKLVAVSKTKPLDAVLSAWNTGHRHFGENYAQELRDKGRAFEEAGRGVHWHYIGQIQRNKIKYIAPRAYRVHALEEVAHAKALAAKAPGPLKVLLSVNVAGERSKGGLDTGQVLERAAEVHEVQGIEVVGLMTMPPFTEDPEDAAPFFDELNDLARRGRQAGLPLHELSMGMSHDFRVAIRHGSTWVRVGTAIFGARGR